MPDATIKDAGHDAPAPLKEPPRPALLQDPEAAQFIEMIKTIAWPAVVIVAIVALSGRFFDALPRPLPVGGVAISDAVVTGLAWPLVVLVSLLLLRKPLSTFFAGLGQRVTKLSAGVVALELSQVAELRAWSGPSLDQIRVPAPTDTAPDSSSGIFAQISQSSPADYTIINLGEGKRWLTSRLFILAVLMERMRGVKCLVFLAEEAGRKQFVGTALPSKVRWALAKQYPWLEAAYVRAYYEVSKNFDPKLTHASNVLITSDHGGLYDHIAQTLFKAFLEELQWPLVTPPYMPPDKKKELEERYKDFQPKPENGWEELRDGKLRERAEWLNEGSLKRLLKQHLHDSWTPNAPDDPAEERVRRVLRRSGPHVALLEEGRRFSSLVDREALLEAVAVSMGREGSGK